MELWLHGFSFPGRVAELARDAEDWGFAGLLIADSQNLTGDVWVELGLAGAATSRLRLGPGVTNPVTRHVAVSASAAATLHAETGGRATLGFAQGDSALSQIGRGRLSVAEFEGALVRLQGFLSGEEVGLEEGGVSAIRWLAGTGLSKVPVHVAASGPRTLAAAARHAEGVDLTVGAELPRVRSASAIARAAGPSGLTVGAYLNVGVDHDRDAARALIRGSVATFARFSAGRARAADLSEVTRRGVERAASDYDRDRHGQASAAFAGQLDDEFIDRFAVAGSPEHVCRRLAEIGACGIERLIMVPGSLDSDPAAVRKSIELFASDVVPLLTRNRA